VNMAGIKAIMALKEQSEQQQQVSTRPEHKREEQEEISDRQLRQMLKTELLAARAQRKVILNQGELSRFFH
jgi:MerR family glutamine synthetase transcriptional repressor